MSFLFLEVFDVPFLFFHFHHFLLHFLLEPGSHRNDNKGDDEDAQDSDDDVQFSVLLPNSAGIVWVINIEIVRPLLKLRERTGFLIIADGNLTRDSIV